MNGMLMDELTRKVYCWLVRDRNTAVGCSSMWTDTLEGENYCGNLLWQSGPCCFAIIGINCRKVRIDG